LLDPGAHLRLRPPSEVEGARADHPAAGLDQAIIAGVFTVTVPIPAGMFAVAFPPLRLNHT
jgi:hypothetical protein